MASQEDSETRRNCLIIILILTVATILKITWAANSIGTSDTVRFFHFGEELLKKPAAEVYAADNRWNQTMTVSWFMRGLASFTKDDGEAFVLWFRMPGILADIAVVLELLLLRRALGVGWGWLALAAASPINLLVCGFHGNLDGLVGAGMFLALAAVVRGSPVLSGIWLGLACHVKVAPVLLAPALAAYWLAHRGFWRFCGSFGALGALMVGTGVAFAGEAFIKHVLAYGSVWGFWGISEILVASGLSVPEVPLAGYKDPVARIVAPAVKVVIIGAAVWLGWIGRTGDALRLFRTAAATLLIFFTLTPGMGYQYMVWWFAIVLVATPRWAAALSCAATALIVVAFSDASVDPFPWRFVNPVEPLTGMARALSFAVWTLFAVAASFAVVNLYREYRSNAAAAAGPIRVEE